MREICGLARDTRTEVIRITPSKVEDKDPGINTKTTIDATVNTA